MKTKTIFFLLSIIVLCQCIKNPHGSTSSDKDFSDITAKFDTMVSTCLHSKYDIYGDVGVLEADTLTAQCYETVLKSIAEKYGEESEEMIACLQHVADGLMDTERPFAQTSVLAYNCYLKVLELNKKMYGENSIPVGKSYANMVYASGRDDYGAQEYADSALKILVPGCGEISVEVGNVYLYLGDSYRQGNHDTYRAAAQYMIGRNSEYLYEEDYETIIHNLEKSLVNYRKALEIYTAVGEGCKEEIADVKECIESTEKVLKNNKEGLAYVKAHPSE